MTGETCDLCDERAGIFGPGGIKYCRTHQDQLWAWKVATERNATEAMGGPFQVVGNCPRRSEGGPVLDHDDQWAIRDGELRCSYCGSIHPDTFMDKICAGVEVGPTDKSYKAYLGDAGTKFYFQHLSRDQRIEFTDMYNAGTINVGYPGHFYTRLFFWAP